MLFVQKSNLQNKWPLKGEITAVMCSVCLRLVVTKCCPEGPLLCSFPMFLAAGFGGFNYVLGVQYAELLSCLLMSLEKPGGTLGELPF